MVSAEAAAAPASAPVTADTQRHPATYGDMRPQRAWAERHVATPAAITRHAGLGLHKRRLPVRFLPHLPEKPEFIWAAVTWHVACFFCAFDPNLTPTSYHLNHHCRSLSVALVVMDFLAQRRAPVAYAQTIAT
jgi:hypothetical protein